MSRTSNTEENWILIQSRYDYIALPVELATEVLKHMKVVSKNGNRISLAAEGAQVHLVSGEQMTVALVKAKMLPTEDKEE